MYRSVCIVIPRQTVQETDRALLHTCSCDDPFGAGCSVGVWGFLATSGSVALAGMS